MTLEEQHIHTNEKNGYQRLTLTRFLAANLEELSKNKIHNESEACFPRHQIQKSWLRCVCFGRLEGTSRNMHDLSAQSYRLCHMEIMGINIFLMFSQRLTRTKFSYE